MKRLFLSLCTTAALAACGSSSPSPEGANATGPAGEPGAEDPGAAPAGPNAAPDFSLPDLEGNLVSLSSFRGQTVVLEWFNPGCPFVQYAHSDEGPLAGAAAKHAIKGVVWLAINSGAPGKQGHGVETNRQAAAKWSMSYPILIDESGGVGQSYGAKTTPHMYVITPEGEIAYRGALDNAPQGKVPAEGSKNYVEAALADLAAGRPVAIAETQSYGCGVKYP
jgi:peroxiredoxin